MSVAVSRPRRRSARCWSSGSRTRAWMPERKIRPASRRYLASSEKSGGVLRAGPSGRREPRVGERLLHPDLRKSAGVELDPHLPGGDRDPGGQDTRQPVQGSGDGLDTAFALDPRNRVDPLHHRLKRKRGRPAPCPPPPPASSPASPTA